MSFLSQGLPNSEGATPTDQITNYAGILGNFIDPLFAISLPGSIPSGHIGPQAINPGSQNRVRNFPNMWVGYLGETMPADWTIQATGLLGYAYQIRTTGTTEVEASFIDFDVTTAFPGYTFIGDLPYDIRASISGGANRYDTTNVEIDTSTLLPSGTPATLTDNRAELIDFNLVLDDSQTITFRTYYFGSARWGSKADTSLPTGNIYDGSWASTERQFSMPAFKYDFIGSFAQDVVKRELVSATQGDAFHLSTSISIGDTHYVVFDSALDAELTQQYGFLHPGEGLKTIGNDYTKLDTSVSFTGAGTGRTGELYGSNSTAVADGNVYSISLMKLFHF